MKIKSNSVKMINGHLMTYSKKYNIWVKSDGTKVYREYKDPTMNRFLQIHDRGDGSKYINTKKPSIIELDLAVADCYVPEPNDWRKYELEHRDANKSNCDKSNLYWKRVPKYDTSMKKRKHHTGLTVTSDGKVYDKKVLLHLATVIGDSDTDRLVAIEPYVRYYRKNNWGNREEKHCHVDKLMAETEFVNGDESTMKNPRVLHKDMDYLNYKADNLEWVEANDPRYIAYFKKKKDDIDKRTIAENPRHPNPLMKFKP